MLIKTIKQRVDLNEIKQFAYVKVLVIQVTGLP